MISISYEKVQKAVRAHGYPWFTGAYNLNVIGIRKENQTEDIFDDTLIIAYSDHLSNNIAECYPITTEPGVQYLTKPINAKGTAILRPGFYPGMWRPGLHKGAPALVQVGKCVVSRDNNRDNKRDHDGSGPVKVEEGIFGIDLHGPHGKKTIASVGLWTAGCQVPPTMATVTRVLSLVDLQKQFNKTDLISYCLLLEGSLNV